METTQAIQALSALAQASRLAIFRLLVEAGPAGMPAGAIGEKLALPPATLSFHLAGLARAGLVNGRQDGRSIIYSTDFAHMNQLVGYLTENCCAGQSCAPASCQPATTKGERHETPTRARRRA